MGPLLNRYSRSGRTFLSNTAEDVPVLSLPQRADAPALRVGTLKKGAEVEVLGDADGGGGGGGFVRIGANEQQHVPSGWVHNRLVLKVNQAPPYVTHPLSTPPPPLFPPYMSGFLLFCIHAIDSCSSVNSSWKHSCGRGTGRGTGRSARKHAGGGLSRRREPGRRRRGHLLS